MKSLRARVAIAAVGATALAFVLSVAVVLGSFVLEFHRGDPWWAQAPSEPPAAGAAAREDQPPWAGRFDGDGPPDFIAQLAGRLAAVNLGVLAVVGGVGLVLGGLALRPLMALQDTAERVASTRDLATRLPQGDGPKEVDALAGSLNAMLARLQRSTEQTEAALEASRRFASDAGHELRTPLTSMRTNLDVLARSPNLSADEQRIMADVAREQGRLLALLDGLQRLARGDAADAVPRERLDLADIVDAAVANAVARYPTATITFAGPEDALIDGWSDGLRLLIDNLLDNAVRHSPAGVHVAVALETHDHSARLVVVDDGPGIPPGDRERVFERFVRGSGARGRGSGLGLALVAQQAALHGGRAVIEDSPVGGTRVVVTLTLASTGDARASLGGGPP